MVRHRFSTVSAACLLVLAVSGAEGGRERPYRIAGEIRDAKGKPAPAERLSFEAPGLRLSIGYLDGAGRRAALASVLGREVDLFPERSAASPGHLAFVLEIGNAGPGDVIFEPGQCRLISNRHDAEFPLDYSSLYGLLGPDQTEVRLEDVERAVFSRAVTIRPGGSVRKLLVFPGPREDRFKALEVRIGALHGLGGDTDAVFRFRKFRVGE